jgi:hypothetical protein
VVFSGSSVALGSLGIGNGTFRVDFGSGVNFGGSSTLGSHGTWGPGIGHYPTFGGSELGSWDPECYWDRNRGLGIIAFRGKVDFGDLKIALPHFRIGNLQNT